MLLFAEVILLSVVGLRNVQGDIGKVQKVKGDVVKVQQAQGEADKGQNVQGEAVKDQNERLQGAVDSRKTSAETGSKAVPPRKGLSNQLGLAKTPSEGTEEGVEGLEGVQDVEPGQKAKGSQERPGSATNVR